MDGGAWWAAVYGAAQSRTRLKQLSSSSYTLSLQKVCELNLISFFLLDFYIGVVLILNIYMYI